jgi:hypothetical protein
MQKNMSGAFVVTALRFSVPGRFFFYFKQDTDACKYFEHVTLLLLQHTTHFHRIIATGR